MWLHMLIFGLLGAAFRAHWTLQLSWTCGDITYRYHRYCGVSPLDLLCLSPDAPSLLPRTTGGHLRAFWVENSGMFNSVGRCCPGSGGAGPGPRFAGPLRTPVSTLRTPRAARRAAFTHSGHSEFTLRSVNRSHLHRFGFLGCFSLHRFRLDDFCGWHFLNFKVTLPFLEETRHLLQKPKI